MLAQVPYHLADILYDLQTFAIMGGLYAAVNCFMKRLRQKDDGKQLVPHTLPRSATQPVLQVLHATGPTTLSPNSTC